MANVKSGGNISLGKQRDENKISGSYFTIQQDENTGSFNIVQEEVYGYNDFTDFLQNTYNKDTIKEAVNNGPLKAYREEKDGTFTSVSIRGRGDTTTNLIFSLNSEETQVYNSLPGAEKEKEQRKMCEAVVQAFSENRRGGKNPVWVEMHDDTDNIHFHINKGRMGFDEEKQGFHTVSMDDFSKASTQNFYSQRLIDSFKEKKCYVQPEISSASVQAKGFQQSEQPAEVQREIEKYKQASQADEVGGDFKISENDTKEEYEYKKAILSKEKEFSSYEKQMQELAQKQHEAQLASKAMQENLKLRSDKQNLQHNIKQLSENYTALQHESDVLQKSYEQLKQNSEILQNDLEVVTQQKNELQSDYNNLQNSYSELQSDYNNLQNNYEAVMEQNGELQSALDAANAKLKEADTTIQSLNSKVEELDLSLSQKAETVNTLQHDLKEKDRELETMKLTIQSKDTQIENLNIQVNDYRQEAKDYRQSYNEQMGKVAEILDDYKNVNKQVKALENENTQLKSQENAKLEEMQKRLEKLEKQNKKLLKDKEHLQSRVSDASAKSSSKNEGKNEGEME